MLLIKAMSGFKDYLKYKQSSNRTIISYMKELKYLNKHLEQSMNGPVYVEDITTKAIEDYLKMKINDTYQASSINKVIYILRSFYKYLVKNEYVTKNIPAGIETLKTHEKEREYLTREEFEKLMNHITHETVKVIAILMFNTGLRISEVTHLKLTDLNLKKNRLKVRSGKGNKDRSVPVNDYLKKILKVYLKDIRRNVQSKNLFVTNRTGSISPVYINQILKQASRDAKLTIEVTAHILRHSFASVLVKENINIAHIQRLLGHSSIKTTARYIHTTFDELEKSVQVINP